MKTGFQVEIDKDLTSDERAIAEHFINEWVKRDSYGTGGWSAHSFYRRGILGLEISKTVKISGIDNKLLRRVVFRRKCKNRRVFIATLAEKYIITDTKVNREILENRIDFIDRSPADLDMCMCSKHWAGLRVKPVVSIDSEIYYTTGDIKG